MTEKIQFRVSPQVDDLLRDFAARHQWSRSKAARYLVEMLLTRDPEQAAVSEIIWSVQAEARKKATLLGQRVDTEIRAQLSSGARAEVPALPAPEELAPAPETEDETYEFETEDGEVTVLPAEPTSGPLPGHLEPVDERLHGLSGRRRRRGRRGGRGR